MPQFVAWASLVLALIARFACGGAVEYRAIFLSPTTIYGSEAHAISGGNVAGALFYGPEQNFAANPVVWRGADEQPQTVPFGEPPASGVAFAIFGDKVGGYVGAGNDVVHAALWKHGESRLVDLNPVHFTNSYCFGVDADHQVGYAIDDRDLIIAHAMLWSGSAHSAVDLDPGDGDSSANAIAGDAIVGSSENHAALWSVATHQFTDLNPDGFSSSSANGAAAGIQVGLAADTNVGRAVAWHSSAASAKLLIEGGFDQTLANAVNDNGVIVGSALKFDAEHTNILFQHAVVWPDESAAPIDLANFLPPGIDSQAFAVDQDGSIVGEANQHAVMWVPIATSIPLPCPLYAGALTLLMAIFARKGALRSRDCSIA